MNHIDSSQDASARNIAARTLVAKHSPIVRRIAWRVHSLMSAAIEVEDLIQTGLVALVEAAQNFEDRGKLLKPGRFWCGFAP